MTKASDNAFPSILITEGTEPTAPAAGKQRLYIDSTSHHLMRTNSSGTETDIEASAGGVAADAIWDAAGDLVVGTGANTGARLAPGTASQVLMGGSTPSWGPGAWTSWTPALTAASVNPTLGTGSTTGGHYLQLGKLVIARFAVAFGSSGTAAGTGEYYVSLPVNADATAGTGATMGTVYVFDSSAGQFNVSVAVRQSASTIKLANHGVAGTSSMTNSSPWAWAANDTIQGLLMYEAA